jgi:hypothetical protein
MEELMRQGEDPNRAQTLMEERKELESLSNWLVWE